MPPAKRTTRVRSHTRSDGTKVKSHNREAAVAQAKAAWAGAGISGLTTLALVFEMGFTIITAVALIITALVGWLAVRASEKATKNKRKLRSTTAARRRNTGRRPAARKRTSRRGSTARKRR
ncbi:hypothetical protein E1287_34630 [Actinomadura sp. KC06]|uniref:hypothetical protein n=1 Tax=Actinomadura sp. KC06 TaxID=2530369 RepID=UPI0010489E78|nr:hypothetical protein [Actinomadura sp. KC06]TDD27355.1 hypothetical protein E1287_34630 [Actinomadura sp. KC06]